tara:strand:+ start:1449 stop:1676 length:228 start_codon:yes stop_codon:yes gene_type:complete
MTTQIGARRGRPFRVGKIDDDAHCRVRFQKLREEVELECRPSDLALESRATQSCFFVRYSHQLVAMIAECSRDCS